MAHYPHLFSPIKIGNVTWKNRIGSAPAGPAPQTSGFYTEENFAYYEIRAKGGAAVVTRGETLIGHRTDSAHGNLCNLADTTFMATHLQFADIMHQHNALANIEIVHSGARAHPQYTNGEIWGPSYEAVGVYGVPVLEMTEDMMEEVADAFANAAAVVQYAGFDMVMLHAGHGWLLSQFLSPVYNRRKDKYGGSIENRARFPMMVIERMRKRVGPDFPIEVRMSGDEFMEGGYGLDDGIEFARIIDDHVDLIHVSATSFKDINSGTRMFPSAFLPHGVNAYLAAAIKKVVKSPVATVGAMSDPAKMEAIIANGEADVIYMARQLTADPYFPNKIKQGRYDEVRPCIRCNHCISLDFVPYVPFPAGISECAVNPVYGRELRESLYVPKPLPKKVLIAGGGPGGMQAALKAAEQGHEVILCEKSDHLGGLLGRVLGDIEFKSDLRRFLDYLIRSVHKEKIDLRLNTEVNAELVAELKPDTLICAIGGSSIVPSIPGVDLPHVIQVASLYEEGVVVGEKVVVVGGGIAGAEDGLVLATQGKDVSIIEIRDEIAKDTPVLHLKALMLEFAKHPDNLHTYTNSTVTKITKEGVYYLDQEGEEHFLPADTVVLAVGMKTKQEEVDKLRALKVDNFIVIGDSKKPGKVLEAITSGYFAGKNA